MGFERLPRRDEGNIILEEICVVCEAKTKGSFH